MSFPKYPEYKDSGVEWLGEVPAHWKVGKIRYFARLESGHTPSRNKPEYWENCTVPWFSLSDVWQIRSGEATEVFDTSEKVSELGLKNSSARILPKGTVMLSRTASVGFSAIMGRAMATTQDFANWVCGDELFAKYLLFCFRGMDREFAKLMRGSTHKTIYMPDIAELTCAVPPLEEQKDIVSSLGFEVRKIDALIEEQQRLIELLKEKRQAVISHAVTKGLDPNVPKKDSGVEWLGEVPAHWVVLDLGRVTVSKCDGPFGSALKSEHYSSAGVRVVRLQNIKKSSFNDRDAAFVSEEYFESLGRCSEVVGGDLLLAGLGDERNAVGRACVAPDSVAPAMVKAGCFRFRLDLSKVLPGFVAEQLSAGAESDAGELATGSTRSRIPLSLMAKRKISIPSLGEQTRVLEYLAKERAYMDELMDEACAAISLLHERRSALISAAVTGKIDVRGWSTGSEEEPGLAMVADQDASYSAHGGTA